MEREGIGQPQPQLEEQFDGQEVALVDTEPLTLQEIEPTTTEPMAAGDMEVGVEVQLPIKKEEPPSEIHDKAWRDRYNRAWVARKEANHEKNRDIFSGYRATTNGVTYFENGQGGRQSKEKQRQQHRRG